MRYFLYAVKRSDVVEGVDAWGETSVKAEDLIIDEGGKGEIVEQIGEVLPDIRVAILSKTFVVEAVNLRDLTGFVVTT
jgi:hypothetical protein